MERIVSRIVRWMSRSACVVTSPMTTHRPLVIAVSHATRACGSWASIPSRTASETWSQTLSGCPSVTDSDVRRKDRDELKDVVTNDDHNLEPVSGPVVVPRILRLLAEELRLHSEYVIQHAVDAPALEAVLDDHASAFEVLPQRNAERTVDAALTPDLRFLEELQAAIQRKFEGGIGSLAWTGCGSKARLANPPAAAPAARPSPATSAARRVTHPSPWGCSSARASRFRNAGCMRCGPCRAPASLAAVVIAAFSSASPPRSLRRRPRRRSETIFSTRFSRLPFIRAAPWPPRAVRAAASP